LPAIPDIKEVKQLVAAGDTRAAEAALSYVFEMNLRAGRKANKAAATAARHLGALTALNNTYKALEAYRSATKLDPNDPTAWNQLGFLLTRVGQLDDGARAFERVVVLSQRIGDKNQVASAYANLGVNYRVRDDLVGAEEITFKSLKLYEELGRKDGMALAYVMLAMIYQRRGEDNRAELMALEGLKLFEELGQKDGMAAAYGILAPIYAMRGDPRAEETALNSLKLFEELGAKPGVAAAYAGLGGLYHTRGDPRAEEMSLKGLKLYEELGYKEGMTGTCTMLALICLGRGDLNRAEEMGLKGLKLFEELGGKDGMAAVHGILGEIYQKKGTGPMLALTGARRATFTRRSAILIW
jgi:protein O-GlcNAc transferase